MLRRNSSNRLSRSKSTSSVHSKHEPLDPEVARKQAHTAANLAFARAQERQDRDADRARSGTQPQAVRRSGSHIAARTLDEHVIKRQHSVRFVGPKAGPNVQRHQTTESRGAPHSQIVPQTISQNLMPEALTTNAPVPAAYRPPSRSSSLGKAPRSRAAAESFVTVNAAYDEHYTREDDVASTPSSYRRVRRSKSMFSPLKAPSIFYTNGTPDRLNDPAVHRQNSFNSSRFLGNTHNLLRAPKSTSFLRGGKDHLTAALRERNDSAVQMARDRFFQQTTQQRLREQPSFLFRSKAKRQEKPFKKSVRSSSTSSYGNPVSSSDTIPAAPRETGLKDVARKASKTIRNKLKLVFGRGKGKAVEIPIQQVDAHETHVRQYSGDGNQFCNIPYPTEASLSRVASRVPLLHNVTSSQHLRSHTGSVKSFLTDRSDEKSRVTSWNSTGVNTVASQARAQTEREQQQRLSIINEHGTHVPTSSFTRPMVKNQLSAYPIVHRGSKSTNDAIVPTQGSIDSARVYSALMKRLDENSPQAKLEASRKASMESFRTARYTALPDEPIYDRGSIGAAATIRQVIPSDELYAAHLNEHSHSVRTTDRNWTGENQVQALKPAQETTQTLQWVTTDAERPLGNRSKAADDVFVGTSATSRGSVLDRQHERPQSRSSGVSRQISTKNPYDAAPMLHGLTPQELALRNEPLIQGTKVVREARSTFFGGSSSFTVSRTPSPFRRALAEAENVRSTQTQSRTPARVSPLRNPLYLASENSLIASKGGGHDADVAYSESVYSRTTSGQTPAADDTNTAQTTWQDNALGKPFFPTDNGDVIIIGSTTYRPTVAKKFAHRVTSSAGSTEWKKWMSSEVAKIERGKENTATSASYVNYALPTMPRSFNAGHVREKAQIDEDDIDAARSEGPVVKQPLGIIQHSSNSQNIPPLKPILKVRSTVSLIENVEPPGTKDTTTIPAPPPLPALTRSPLRSTKSKSSLRSVVTANSARAASAPGSAVKSSSISGRHVLHKRNASSTTLRSTKSVETPAKLIKRTGRPINVTPNRPTLQDGTRDLDHRSLNGQATSIRSRTAVSNNRQNAPSALIDLEDIYGSEGAGLTGPVSSSMGERGEMESQAIGSKWMVDMFLSSRRKRIASGSEENEGRIFL